MNRSEMSGQPRLLPLEALRGIAAIFVVLHHFILAFFPRALGITALSGLDGSLVGSPMLVFFNGKAMIAIFFVLSGFVLARKGLERDASRAIGNAAIKRWFRFVLPICLSLLFSWALFMAHFYRYNDVCALNGALWLNHFDNLPQSYSPRFTQIAYEGFFGSMFLGDNRFNAVLWTMHLEFYGSMLVFLLALLLAPQRRWWFNIMFPLAAICAFSEAIWIFPLMAGMLGAVAGLERRAMGVKRTILMALAGLYFCGYYYPRGWYGWLAGTGLSELKLRVLILTIGGSLMLIVFVTKNPFSARFNGAFSRLVGRMSFSIYLMHTLIITSFCAQAYVAMHGGASGILAAFITLALLLPPLSYAMTLMDEWWLRLLARWHPAGVARPL